MATAAPLASRRAFASSVARHLGKRGMTTIGTYGETGDGLACTPSVAFCLGADLTLTFTSKTTHDRVLRMVVDTLHAWGRPLWVEGTEEPDEESVWPHYRTRVHVDSPNTPFDCGDHLGEPYTPARA